MKGKRTGKCIAHAAFDQWYAQYPLKRSRGQAEKAFAKIDPDQSLLSEMIQALERQKAERSAKQEGGEWVPQWKHPTTWLNGRCWEDEEVGDTKRVDEPETDWLSEVGL
jgi:hypothetical protein